MKIFRNALLNELANTAIYAFFDVIRIALTIARFLNGLCFLVASAGLFALAIYLAQFYGPRIPSYYTLAFLIGWWGLAMGISGLERIARCKPRKEERLGRPMLTLERPVSATATQFRSCGGIRAIGDWIARLSAYSF